MDYNVLYQFGNELDKKIDLLKGVILLQSDDVYLVDTNYDKIRLKKIREVDIYKGYHRILFIRIRTEEICLFIASHNNSIFKNKIDFVNNEKSKELSTKLKNYIWI